MFLSGLINEQKLAFLNLAYALIAADGILNKDELLMIEQYKQEMGISVSLDEAKEEIEKSIDVFKKASISIKKQISFELVALAYADREYTDTEYTFIEKIETSLGLDASFLAKCKEYVEQLINLYEKIGKLIEE